MGKKVHKESIVNTIIKVIRKQPNKRAHLSLLYDEVPKNMGKDVSADIIRGSIMRRTQGVESRYYSVLFKRVSPGTYELID